MENYSEYIIETIRDISGFDGEIEASWDLVSKRIIKSVMLLELISEFEEEYDFEVTAQDIYDGHFISVESMNGFIQSKLKN